MEEHEPAMLLRIDKLELHPLLLKHILEGSNVTGIFDDLPLEQLLVLDTVSDEMPGLRWILRKQRGRYLLTVLSTKHVDKSRKEVKGQP